MVQICLSFFFHVSVFVSVNASKLRGNPDSFIEHWKKMQGRKFKGICFCALLYAVRTKLRVTSLRDCIPAVVTPQWRHALLVVDSKTPQLVGPAQVMHEVSWEALHFSQFGHYQGQSSGDPGSVERCICFEGRKWRKSLSRRKCKARIRNLSEDLPTLKKRRGKVDRTTDLTGGFTACTGITICESKWKVCSYQR